MNICINELTLIGKIARDPRFADTPNGSVADFRVVVTKNIRKKNGDIAKNTIFMDCEVWGRRSNFIKENAQKGDTIYVRGRLCKKNYTTTKGVDKSKYILKVEQFLLQPNMKNLDFDPLPEDEDKIPFEDAIDDSNNNNL